MPDEKAKNEYDEKLKNQQEQEKNEPQIPIAAIVWMIVAALIFVLGGREVTMQDEERFPADFELTTQEVDQPNTVQATIVGGTFKYNVVPENTAEVPTGTFGPDTDNPVAAVLFENIPDLTEVLIEPQTMTLTYDNDIEAELYIRRAQRPVVNAVFNDSGTITSDVLSAEDKQFLFTTTDEHWLFGSYIASLIPEGQEEVYDTREAGQNGSELAQFIFGRINALEALTITPSTLTVTYREGAVENQVIERLTEALNDYHPRASLQPNLWLISLGLAQETILNIGPLDTGIPLVAFALAFALLEGAMMVYFRNTDDKLVRPIVRAVGVFLFFWSIFGHEPIWDYLLSQLFPTSRQLVHPNGTVIQFAAQHMELVIVSSLITVPAGLIFGILVTRENFRELLPLVNNMVNSGQTVPTIAIVAFMAPIIGFGFWPAIIALIAYGLLPVVRNTIAGLESVDAFVIDSARGMGMTPTQILLQIELPIASSVIMAGIRTSMVINVGTATLGAFVGSGGLGTPIASGLSMTVDSFILLGAIPAAALAILIDYVLGRIEFVITPRGLQIEK